MTEAEKEMKVLEGEPVTIKLMGREITLERMKIKKQKQLVQMFTDAARGASENDGTSLDLMIAIVSFATGISKEDIEEKGTDVREVVDAFQAIWDQNGLSFLLRAIVKVTSKLGGDAGIGK